MSASRSRKSAGTQPPSFDFDESVLGDLDPGDDGMLDAGRLDGVAYADIAREAWELGTGATIEACRFDRLGLETWTLRGARLVESVFANANVPVVSGARSTWRDVDVRDSRFGSVELYDAAWRGIRFTRCRLGYVNLRAAELLDVAFIDCTIDEIDLMDASARRVAFDATRIATLNATGARLADVDLRGAELGSAVGIDGLRGATISALQLQLMAPALAELAGLVVED
ncbi:pentapeptide repeat-containing protein [Microbacterium sp. M3]|uniref:Pentapeptide repeat-containing protein n=1 Tax=Microbacterium arthrosphaerae TaxID=792652 RepID=A0ABU4GYD4_9MICO|nr:MULTISPECIES: pentapeptide repeat-containing protein [Microbacterium]MDW4572098.1 pentapeptide repeat-containing protein [Microbacterium arthrosphaerae]MDW7605953.1 pentapeptide repeat-containing protein [Microbacterium sp. M3]